MQFRQTALSRIMGFGDHHIEAMPSESWSPNTFTAGEVV